jgi:dTDP-4-amino-4,6-dideoxygalactose transaminase
MAPVSTESAFVPALPTLWPSMLFAAARQAAFPPFASPSARYFYFARNAVWTVVRIFKLVGAEVLVPAYHHGVEVEALLDAGAQVRFYRVGARWDVDLADVARRIGPNTRALYLTHYAGFPGPAAQMRELADRNGLVLIEDCALSLLSSEGRRPLGTVGDVAVFCLYKTLPLPNGGALVVNGDRGYALPELPTPPLPSTVSHAASALLMNLELRAGAPGRMVRNVVRGVGRSAVRTASVDRVATGTQHFNRAHLDLGISRMSRRIASAQDLEGIVERRRRNYFLLLGALRGVSAPIVSQLSPGVCPLFFPLLVQDKARLRKRLAARGIETVDFWSQSHPGCDLNEFPEVRTLRRTVVEIPCHQDLTPERTAWVAEEVRAALRG